MRSVIAIGAVLVILTIPILSPAQVTGRLIGNVVDQTGAAVPGAAVSLILEGGERAVLTTVTNEGGLFTFGSVVPGSYNLVVEATGFRKQTVTAVKVETTREAVYSDIRLELQSVTAEVQVSVGVPVVQVSSSDVATTITNQQIQKLPSIDRDPLGVLSTQAGVTNGRGNAVINGQRTAFSNVTLDGINVQDNLFRDNGLEFLPNLILLDQVSEVSVVTSNGSSVLGNGASHVTFVTPSGTNQFHGGLYWYNRNSAFSANDWFNNRDGIKNPQLNQNQAGGTIGGPIFRDKLFFYNNYEAYRLRQKSSVNRTILTADARRGIFTYRDNTGTVQKVNILAPSGTQIDPIMTQVLAQLPGPENINNNDVGDSTAALQRNTAGYSFVQRSARTRDNVTTKLDYYLSTKHHFSGSYLWNRDIVDRGDVNTTGYTVVPKVKNDGATNLVSLAWRWSPTASFTNEVRGGFNLAPAVFATDEEFPAAILTGYVFSNPLNTFRAQGRDTNTYNYNDNASYFRGKHNLQFGFSSQIMRSAPYNDAGITPTYTIGLGTGNPVTTGPLPGISATDQTAANNLLATLGGYVTSYSQTFNITSRESGFVNGATNLRNFSFDQYGFYIQDNWKTTPRLTTTLGLRYDIYTVVDERDGLVLLPTITNNNVIGTLLSNATLDFAGGSTGRQFYNQDRNNFGPNFGLAFDVFGDGKTSLRGGYSISYVNDAFIAAARNNVVTNAGLSITATRSGLTGRASSLPPVVPPAYKVPRTFAENNAVDTQSAFGVPDPNMRTPYVQEWSFGIQHEFRGTVFEARYVGNHGTKEIRGIDYNQVLINTETAAGFLDDFKRARSNGFASRAATGVYNPDYQPSVPGSQPLTFFPRLGSGGLLTNATIRTLIETGQVGELAHTYQINLLQGTQGVNFYRNIYANGANIIGNFSNSTYNSLQTEVRRRISNDLQFQGNYTFSKVLSDSISDSQTRFEALLDNANPKAERARPGFDTTHVFNFNGTYNLPFGSGHRLDMADRGMSRLISGWTISSILQWQSGGPFSVLSNRGTLNRGGRSTGTNTAVSNLTNDQLKDLNQFRMTSTGPYIMAASAIGADGRAVAADGAAPFNGQVFFQPEPGTIGNLQRRMFNNPSVSVLHLALGKTTRIGENQSVEFKAESFNALNHPSFYNPTASADQSVTSTNFGKLTSTFYDRRVVQFSLHYKF